MAVLVWRFGALVRVVVALLERRAIRRHKREDVAVGDDDAARPLLGCKRLVLLDRGERVAHRADRSLIHLAAEFKAVSLNRD